MRLRSFFTLVIIVLFALSTVFATSILRSLDEGLGKLSSLVGDISKFNSELAESNDKYLKQENKYLLVFNNTDTKGQDLTELSPMAKDSIQMNREIKQNQMLLTSRIETLNKEITDGLRPQLKVEKNEAIDFLKYKVPDHLQAGFENLFDIQRIKSSDIRLYVLCEKVLTDLGVILDIARGETQVTNVKREFLFKINSYRFEKIQELKIRHYLKLKAGRLAKVFNDIHKDLKKLLEQRKSNLALKQKVLKQFQEAKRQEQTNFSKSLKASGLNFELRFILLAEQIKNQLFMGISLFLPLVLFVLFIFFKMIIGPLQSLMKGNYKSKLPFLKEMKDLVQKYREQQVLNLSLQGELIRKEKLAVMGGVTNMIAHEFKNPLSIIQLSLDDLRDIVDKKSQSEVDKIEQMVDRMNQQIQNLNSFANHEMTKDQVVIGSLLKNVFDMHRGILDQKQIQYKIEVKDEVPDLELPMSLLEIVFINLLGNSIRALEGQDEPFILVDVQTKENKVVVRFQDNGEGIPKENIDKVFQAYFSTKEDESGSGLGLHIVKNILSQIHGEIRTESEPEEHTTFFVELPIP